MKLLLGGFSGPAKLLLAPYRTVCVRVIVTVFTSFLSAWRVQRLRVTKPFVAAKRRDINDRLTAGVGSILTMYVVHMDRVVLYFLFCFGLFFLFVFRCC